MMDVLIDWLNLPDTCSSLCRSVRHFSVAGTSDVCYFELNSLSDYVKSPVWLIDFIYFFKIIFDCFKFSLVVTCLDSPWCEWSRLFGCRLEPKPLWNVLNYQRRTVGRHLCRPRRWCWAQFRRTTASLLLFKKERKRKKEIDLFVFLLIFNVNKKKPNKYRLYDLIRLNWWL